MRHVQAKILQRRLNGRKPDQADLALVRQILEHMARRKNFRNPTTKLQAFAVNESSIWILTSRFAATAFLQNRW
jgi:hypothetical protein